MTPNKIVRAEAKSPAGDFWDDSKIKKVVPLKYSTDFRCPSNKS